MLIPNYYESTSVPSLPSIRNSRKNLKSANRHSLSHLPFRSAVNVALTLSLFSETLLFFYVFLIESDISMGLNYIVSKKWEGKGIFSPFLFILVCKRLGLIPLGVPFLALEIPSQLLGNDLVIRFQSSSKSGGFAVMMAMVSHRCAWFCHFEKGNESLLYLFIILGCINVQKALKILIVQTKNW